AHKSSNSFNSSREQRVSITNSTSCSEYALSSVPHQVAIPKLSSFHQIHRPHLEVILDSAGNFCVVAGIPSSSYLLGGFNNLRSSRRSDVCVVCQISNITL